MIRFATAVIVCVGTWAPAAQAHHSLGMFDANRQITLQGVVSRYEWLNPHAALYVNVTDTNGQTSEWKMEGGSLGMMVRGGWRADSFMPGDTVSVVVHPPRTDAKNFGQIVTATLADGRVLSATPR